MAQQVLDNATLWIGDGTSHAGHVVVEGGKIEAVGHGRYRGPAPLTDLHGAALSPGMIDLMVLGGWNKSLLRDDQVDIAREYLRLGVTALQVCTGTLPWEAIAGIAVKTRTAMAYRGNDAARIIGWYPEGPFQHPDFTGASSREFAIPPSRDNVRRILDEAGDTITVINVSPGTEGDTAAVRAFRNAGVVVSMAHSAAPAERVLQCVDAGTSVIGHCWDNNSGLRGDSGVQQPTLEHVALTDDRVAAIHLITDGAHVHPILVRMILRCRGVESICLVTDCNQRSGCEDGPFVWDDGRPMYKKGGVCRTAEKDNLAGSATLLPDDFRNFVMFTGLPPHQAIRTVTFNAAASIGLDGEMGLIAPGRAADLVTWNETLRVRRVWRGGEEVKNVSDFGEVTYRAA